MSEAMVLFVVVNSNCSKLIKLADLLSTYKFQLKFNF